MDTPKPFNLWVLSKLPKSKMYGSFCHDKFPHFAKESANHFQFNLLSKILVSLSTISKFHRNSCSFHQAKQRIFHRLLELIALLKSLQTRHILLKSSIGRTERMS